MVLTSTTERTECLIVGDEDTYESYVETPAEPMVTAYFGPEPITPDGRGGIDVRPERMAAGLPYPFVFAGKPLVAIKEPGGFVTFFGFVRDNG